jgi:hypothetical protein
MNPETFRFYEALDCGCIPLIVKNEKNAAWITWISEHLPFLPVASWEDAAQLMNHLMTQKQTMEVYRNKLITAWMEWKDALSTEVRAILATPQ